MKYYMILLLISSIIIFFTAAECENNYLNSEADFVSTQQLQESKLYPIAIVGGGAAGIMALKRAILNNCEVLFVIGSKQDQRRSRGHWVRKVDNVPGLEKYERTIVEMRNDTLNELSQGAFKHNLFVSEASVDFIEKKGDVFKLQDSTGLIHYAKYLVLATGVMDEQPLIQGSIRPILKYANGQTIVYCPLCDGHRSFRKKTVVIGHSETAACTALFLKEQYQLTSVAILTNGYTHEFSADSLEQLHNYNIPIYLAPIQEVLGDLELKQLAGFKLDNDDIITAEIGFVILGIRPNNALALQLNVALDDRGLVITDFIGESSMENLFVAGDLRSDSMKQIYTAWQQAVEIIQLISWRLKD